MPETCHLLPDWQYSTA